MIKIIDNLLPHMQWVGLHDYYLRGDCPWVYSEHVVCDEEKNPHFQFVHGILLGSGVGPTLIEQERLIRIQPILDKLNIAFLLRAKVNLTTRTHEPVQTDFHCDTDNNNLTAIYYMNTCNGKTRFENPEIGDVDSVGNRIVIFNAKQKHCTVTATDVQARVVININYLPRQK